MQGKIPRRYRPRPSGPVELSFYCDPLLSTLLHGMNWTPPASHGRHHLLAFNGRIKCMLHLNDGPMHSLSLKHQFLLLFHHEYPVTLPLRVPRT